MATLGTGSGGLATNGLDIVDGEGVSGSSTAYSLTSVDTESPAGSAPQTVAFPVGWLPSVTGYVAQADGTKANATELGYGISGVTVVAGAADSVLLPPAYPGAVCCIVNTIATAIQVFGQGTDTISGVATGTGVSQAASKADWYVCFDTGAWWQIVAG